MPAGTWNLGKIQKTVSKIGLSNLSTIRFFDDSPLSNNYFNVVDFPARLTAGKNLIKFNGIQLPGGVAINGREIFEDAEKEIAEIEQASASTYELPPFDMIG